MNNLFRDPYELTALPEFIEEYLEHGATCCISMNHRGTICAAGCMDGLIVLWDMSTRGVGRTYQPHTSRITSLHWSRNGRTLVSSSLDGSVVWWDMVNNVQLHKSNFSQPVIYTSLRARDCMTALVSLQQGPPQLVTVSPDSQEFVTAVPTLVIDSDSKTGCHVNLSGEGVTAVAALSQCGRMVIVGHQKATLLLLRRSDMAVLDVIRIQGSPKILAVGVHPQGKLLVNCSDRCLRLYIIKDSALDAALQENLPDVHVVKRQLMTKKVARQGSILLGENAFLMKDREFANAVERMQWKAACFTQDGEHVVGVPDAKGKHHIYIWHQVWGKLERVLEGPKEGALDVACDPSSNMLLSVGQYGRVYLWCTKCKDNWSAFAPDFKELTENEEYIEAEDEFDTNDKDVKPKPEVVDFSSHVDLFTPPKVQPLYSEDEDDAVGFWHLPFVVDFDEEVDAGAVDQAANGHSREPSIANDAAATQADAIGPEAATKDKTTDQMDIDPQP